VIGHGSLGAGGNTSKRRLTEMSLWLLKKVVVLVTPWVKTSGGYEHGAREEYEEGVSPKPKIRGETERKMEMMGHDTSQPATSAVRGTKPRSEERRELQLLPVDVFLIPVHIIDGRFCIPLLVSPMTRRGQRSGDRQLQKARPSEPGCYMCGLLCLRGSCPCLFQQMRFSVFKSAKH
jgi:hypothetical protein